MAEEVKKRSRNNVKLEVGNRVSVSCTYFDSPDDAEYLLSCDYPENVIKLVGTVVWVYTFLKKCRVRWDIDNQLSDIPNADLKLEDGDFGVQFDAGPSGLEARNYEDNDKDCTDISSDSDNEMNSGSGIHRVLRQRLSNVLKVKIEGKKKLRNKSRKLNEEQEKNESEEEPEKEIKVRKTKKKVAVQKQKENPMVEEEDLNVLDYDEETDEELEKDDKQKNNDRLKEEEKIWERKGWSFDPRKINGGGQYGPRFATTANTHLDLIFAFLPINFIKREILPAINIYGKNESINFKEVTLTDFIHFLALMYSMEVYQLPIRRMYWEDKDNGLFKGLDYGRYMKLYRFEQIIRCLQFSGNPDRNEQILDFINACNDTCQRTIIPGDYLCVDESMIKSFHRNLLGKMKIKRKPRPIGNELKTCCDCRSKIVINMELYEGVQRMREKEGVQELGATTATTLRLTEPWRGSGRVVVADSWFGSIKTAVQLVNTQGLHFIGIVKTAHKGYPRQMLREKKINRGEWNSVSGVVDGVKLLAVHFVDLQVKEFVSTCSISLPGPSRKTKHHGLIPRPQVAYEYLQNAAGIDIHNHVRTGSKGLEDAWLTKDPCCRQFAGVLGFMFSNAFLAHLHFNGTKVLHADFKMELVNAMLNFNENAMIERRPNLVAIGNDANYHHLKRIEDVHGVSQKVCFFCQHGRMEPKKRKTRWYCGKCGVEFPLCACTVRDCFQQHIQHGMPKKRRCSKN